MLKPRDGTEKDEGQLTGGKRLIRRLGNEFGHFADVITADALYLDAPFINTVLECGMDVVIWLKDEKRLIFQNAKELIEREKGQKEIFQKGRPEIDVWDLSGFEIENVESTMRVVKRRGPLYVVGYHYLDKRVTKSCGKCCISGGT